MSHHHKINAEQSMPTSAGKWRFTGIAIFPDSDLNANYHWFERNFDRLVIVEENPTSGRMCRALKMGGSIHCGLQPWSGRWRKVQ